jgi:hypothetical protein
MKYISAISAIVCFLIGVVIGQVIWHSALGPRLFPVKSTQQSFSATATSRAVDHDILATIVTQRDATVDARARNYWATAGAVFDASSTRIAVTTTPAPAIAFRADGLLYIIDNKLCYPSARGTLCIVGQAIDGTQYPRATITP